MDYTTLKILHLAGVFALFSSLGATMLGGSRKAAAGILHGTSLVLILVVGLMMVMQAKYTGMWWMLKFGIWLFIGVAPVLVKKKILPPSLTLALTIAAASGAAYLGIYKPF